MGRFKESIITDEMITLAVRYGVSERAFQALQRLEGVTVTRAPQTALITKDALTALDVLEVGVGDESLEQGIGAATLLLFSGVLSDEHAARLEDRGQAFVDAAGRAWVPGAPRSTRARAEGQSRTRYQSLRAAQLIADHPDRKWSGGTLAESADVSRGTGERLLLTLADTGLVARHGAGRGAFAAVTDLRGMRRWLMRHGGRQRDARLPIFVRNPERLPGEIDGVYLVRSGTYGAALIGMPVVSNTPRPIIRVELTGNELESLPSRLRGMRTTEGANALLVADPGRLASLDAREVGGVLVAPPSRLALDMLLEPRGDAAADVFLDLWDDRVL